MPAILFVLLLGCDEPTSTVYFLVFDVDDISGAGGKTLKRGTVGESFSRESITEPMAGDVEHYRVSPDGSRFLVQYYGGGTTMGQGIDYLFLMDTDGGNQEQIEIDLDRISYPEFAGADRIVFAGRDEDEPTAHLYTADLDGGNLEVLVEGFDLTDPMVATRDGGKVAAVRPTAQPEYELVVIDTGSGEVTVVKTFPGGASQYTGAMVFSAGGDKLAFSEYDHGDEYGGIKTVNLDGSGETAISVQQPLYLALTPDGTLVFGTGAVWEVGFDGGEEENLADPPQEEFTWEATQAVITADRKHLVFVAVHTDGSSRIHYRDLGESKVRESVVAKSDGIFSLTTIF